jgi:hypothetical protein
MTSLTVPPELGPGDAELMEQCVQRAASANGRDLIGGGLQSQN